MPTCAEQHSETGTFRDVRDAESDWLPFTIGAVTATFAAMGAIAFAVTAILPAGHVLSDEVSAPATTGSPLAAIVTPSPSQVTAIDPAGVVAVSGVATNLPTGWTLWLFHQFPDEGHLTVGPAALTVSAGAWSVVDRPLASLAPAPFPGPAPEPQPGDLVNLQLVLAPPACAVAIRAITPSTTGLRIVPALPSDCPRPSSVVRLRVALLAPASGHTRN
jgi:hypothetical protein